MADLEFFRWLDPPIIQVKAPGSEITIQELITKIRNYEDEPMQMDIARIADAAGKSDLGGGLYTGITVTLYRWKLQFEPRGGPSWSVCNVRGGNLVGLDENGDPQEVIEPAAYVTVKAESDTSAALVISSLQQDEITFLYKVARNKKRLHKVSDTEYQVTVYDDDDVTPLVQWTLEQEAVTEDEVRTLV